MRRILKLFKNDFKNVQNNEPWYDLFDDWELVVSSLYKQYGLRIRKEIDTLSWGELSSYIAGIMPDTPLRKHCINKK